MKIQTILSKMTNKKRMVAFIQNLVENNIITTQYAMILLRDFVGITNNSNHTINFVSNIDFFDLLEIYHNQ
jgi:hypothetical protein